MRHRVFLYFPVMKEFDFTVRNYRTQDRISLRLPVHSRSKQDKAHRSRPSEGVVTYVEGVGEEKRRIVNILYTRQLAPSPRSFKKQARQGAPEPPFRRRSYLRRGSRRGETPYCVVYWMNILSPKEKNLYLSLTATLYAFITFLCPANALTSIIRVLSGRWKLVISPSIALKRYPG